MCGPVIGSNRPTRRRSPRRPPRGRGGGGGVYGWGGGGAGWARNWAGVAANVRWLARYRHPRCGGREDLIVRLLEVFAQPTPLFAGADRVGDRLLVLPVLYHLLWRQVLVADLRTALLGPSTLVEQEQRRRS